MQSAPFHWNPADARHLARARRRIRDGNTRDVILFAVVLAIAIAALRFAGMGDDSLILATGLAILAPAARHWWQVIWIGRWLRFHAECEVTAIWDDASYWTEGCRHAPSPRMSWQQFVLAIETDRYLVLETREAPFFLPKAALTAEAYEGLRATLAANRIPVFG